jgi:hypothetical protein
MWIYSKRNHGQLGLVVVVFILVLHRYYIMGLSPYIREMLGRGHICPGYSMFFSPGCWWIRQPIHSVANIDVSWHFTAIFCRTSYCEEWTKSWIPESVVCNMTYFLHDLLLSWSGCVHSPAYAYILQIKKRVNSGKSRCYYGSSCRKPCEISLVPGNPTLANSRWSWHAGPTCCTTMYCWQYWPTHNKHKIAHSLALNGMSAWVGIGAILNHTV